MLRLRFAAIVAGVFLATLFSIPAFADGVTILSIDPASSTVNSGNSLTLDVNISDVTDLYGFGFDLSFDPGILSAVSIAESSFLSGAGTTFFIPGTIDNTAGTITFTADSLIGPGPGVNGSGTLAILTLSGLITGSSNVNFSNVLLLDSNLNPIDANTQSGTVTVTSSTSVPEPSTLVLLFAAMGFFSLKFVRKTFSAA